MTDPRIPVTLLTGFLGAGKTTLLNAVLSDASSGRIAVIVNEFGKAGLDHDLILSSSEEIVLMQSGCLCCTLRGDLTQTIADLIARRNREELEFDRLVIETTGLADPGPILQTLLIDPLLVRNTRMDGVVTAVDAVNGAATLDAQFEAVSQAAMADLIVLTKTDLAQPVAVTALEHRLRSLNPTAQIIHSVRGQDIAQRLWGVVGLRRGASQTDVLAWTTVAPDPLANLSGFAAPAPTQIRSLPHDGRISSASIILDEPIPDTVFDRWLETLIGRRGNDILRVKGIVCIEGIEAPFVFHGVQHIFDPPVPMRDWPGDDRRTRIVVIARDMSEAELQAGLETLRMPNTATVTEKVANL